MDEKYTSRFFVKEDPHADNFVFADIRVSPHWTSRPYEYAWCSEHAARDDVALDAASGICHPLRFYLARNCREVHACDIDERILSAQAVKEEVATVFGVEALTRVPEADFARISHEQCSITDMPYTDRKFDKIYCVSVLEHLRDTYNKMPFLYRIKMFDRFCWQDIYLSLKEFERVLKDDGLIVLTFDYPRINLSYLSKVLPDVGLKFAGDVCFDMPENAVRCGKLSFFRAALLKQDQRG